MKKIFALLIVTVLVLSLAACGNSSKDVTAAADAQVTQAIEETAAETEAPTENPKMAVIGKDQLVGSWTYPGMEDFEKLTFNDDGTGTYVSLDGKDLTFIYAINPTTETYGNGEEYVDNHMIVEYDTGETEDIIIFFNEDDHLCFHNSENGGYNGVFSFPEWARE